MMIETVVTLVPAPANTITAIPTLSARADAPKGMNPATKS
ncbi:unnamed protein product [Urochloa humidicola]